MAIVKASYTRSSGAAKANVRYITHRAGKDGEKITRRLFGFDGPVTKAQIYERINQLMKGTYFYRLKLSTDPRKEDWDKQLDLQEVTKQAVRELEKQLSLELGRKIQLEFFAAIHDDHTAIRHVHILAFTAGKLSRLQLKTLTAGATKEAGEQRKQLDRALGIGEEQTAEVPHQTASLPQQRGYTLYAGKPGQRMLPLEAPACPRCETQMAFLGTACICSGCGLKFALGPKLSLGREVARE